MLDRMFGIKHGRLAVALGVLLAGLTSCTAVVQESHDRLIDRKVDALLKQMTVQEKIGQLNQSFHFIKTAKVDQRIIDGEIGSLQPEFDPVEMNRVQHLAVDKSRLHIPLLFMMDVIHGFGVTFPVPLANAASWDMAMIQQEQGMAAKVARHAGTPWSATQMVDIARDPRWAA